MTNNVRTHTWLDTGLGPLACRSSGEGPAIVFFAGALANGELWRDVVARLEDEYRCITVDLPLGSHAAPLDDGADRSVPSLAALLLDCLDLLDVDDATVVVNDTAGGLLLLGLASDHPALARIGRLALTNCESYDQFPPTRLRRAATVCRTAPRIAGALLRAQLRLPAARRAMASMLAATPLGDDRADAFFGPIRRDPRVAGDLVAAQAGEHPDLLLTAAPAIGEFRRPVLLVWGDRCEFFPLAHARRLAAAFPDATLVVAPGAKTWVPIDAPATLAGAVRAMPA